MAIGAAALQQMTCGVAPRRSDWHTSRKNLKQINNQQKQRGQHVLTKIRSRLTMSGCSFAQSTPNGLLRLALSHTIFGFQKCWLMFYGGVLLPKLAESW